MSEGSTGPARTPWGREAAAPRPGLGKVGSPQCRSSTELPFTVTCTKGVKSHRKAVAEGDVPETILTPAARGGCVSSPFARSGCAQRPRRTGSPTSHSQPSCRPQTLPHTRAHRETHMFTHSPAWGVAQIAHTHARGQIFLQNARGGPFNLKCVCFLKKIPNATFIKPPPHCQSTFK